jgi:phenylpropionate dioxygenase-like ring-hydroxylating dioxygenase large terminal subunit
MTANAPQVAGNPILDTSLFPEWPIGWYFVARSEQLRSRPLGVQLFGRRLVLYRAQTGQPVAMDARCWHMGADLSAGSVVGDRIKCAFHGWEFGSSGRCELIPAQAAVPQCAQQQSYPVAETAGAVFIFPSSAPIYPLPFFSGSQPRDFVAAPAFKLVVNCPWWLVGTNGFDLQHFCSAHDRRIVAPPILESPHPAARRIVTEFEVCGEHWRDRVTRSLAGNRVTMDVTMWSGTLAFVVARFRQADSPSSVIESPGDQSSDDQTGASYGFVQICPDRSAPGNRTRVRVTIFRRRRRGLRAIDWLDVRIKRSFIRAFLSRDVVTLDGVRLDPSHLIEADGQMIAYLRWLATASRGQLSYEDPK